MKIGIVGPTLHMFIEKYAALFYPDPVVIFSDPQYQNWNDVLLGYIGEFWNPVNLNIEYRIQPYGQWDVSDIDVMVESIECFQYGENWKHQCLQYNCPTIFKVCFINDGKFFPEKYLHKIRKIPAVVEADWQVGFWQGVGLQVTKIHNPVGHWWFEKEYIGDEETAVYVVAGMHKWRGDGLSLGWDWWQEIERTFPGKTLHHDAAELGALTPLQLVDMFSHKRAFVNLDWDSGRPLSTAFCEALSIGMPVISRRCSNLNYQDFIDTNGIATNDKNEMYTFIEHCLNDIEFAKQCGKRSREIAQGHFSHTVARNSMNNVIDRAIETFKKG